MDGDNMQPLLIEVINRRVRRDAPAPRRRAWSVRTSRIARAADAGRKLRSAALSNTSSSSVRMTATWTTAVGETVWLDLSRCIRRTTTWYNLSETSATS
jgi:hypothetical protein